MSVALGAYHDQARIVLGASAPAVRAAMVADWWEAKASGASVTMLALRRADVEALNSEARSHMARAGFLGDEERQVGGRTFAVGDEVIGLRNDARIGILNGTRAKVSALGPNDTMSLERADGTNVEVPAHYLGDGHLAHSYAMTIHKAQGATFDRTFVLGSDALYREAGYVAMSRARLSSHIYVVGAEHDLDSHAGVPEPADPSGELERALSASRAKALASDGLAGELSPAGLVAMEAEYARLLQTLLPTLVPDPTARIAAWANQRDRLSSVFGAAVETGGAVELGRWARAELERSDARRPALDALAAARAGWQQENASELAHYAELRGSIGQARSAIATVAELCPSHYLRAALGPVPLGGAERRAWRQAAVGIESYRAAHAITDSASPIGPPPADRLQRAAWEATMVVIETARAQLGIERGREPEGLEMGGPM
ncbi:MAG: ATP-binding domain-containing protein [Acidimicrobiales bacterium]